MPSSETIARFNALPDEERLIAAEKALGIKYKNSLYHLCKYGLKYTDIVAETHRPIFKALSSDDRRVLLCLPRGSFKSSIASIGYPIQCLLRDPDARILIDSELYTNSKNFLREVKAHLEGEHLERIYGKFESRTWNEGEIIIRQRTRARKEASITCGGISTNKTGMHYTHVIMDDSNGPSNSLTPENRKKVIDHYRYMTSILEPTGRLVVVGTRYSQGDLIGWIMENELNAA